MVCLEDIPLQCFSFFGKIFIESSITFGACSSPSIFHWISEIVPVIATVLAMMRRKHVLKQLDDVVAFGVRQLVTRFNRNYKEVCSLLRVRLASNTDPDKCFSAKRESYWGFSTTLVTGLGPS